MCRRFASPTNRPARPSRGLPSNENEINYCKNNGHTKRAVRRGGGGGFVRTVRTVVPVRVLGSFEKFQLPFYRLKNRND